MLFRPSFYKDRQHAGTLLARAISAQFHFDLILALPRGGIPVAIPIATTLACPLNILITRKIGHPHNPEFALGALAEPAHLFIHQENLTRANLSLDDLQSIIASETRELKRRIALYRTNLPFPPVKHAKILLVDDGIATGASIIAATESLQILQAAQITVAAPVAHPAIASEIRSHATLITLHEPPDLTAIGNYYANFAQLTDKDVASLLQSLPQP